MPTFNTFLPIGVPIDFDSLQSEFAILQTWGVRLRELVTTGSWTPVDESGVALVLTNTYPSLYVKIGPLVYVSLDVTYPTTADTTAAKIRGLPFVNVNSPAGLTIAETTYTTAAHLSILPNTTHLQVNKLAGGQATNANLSTLTIRASGVYQTAA